MNEEEFDSYFDKTMLEITLDILALEVNRKSTLIVRDLILKNAINKEALKDLRNFEQVADIMGIFTYKLTERMKTSRKKSNEFIVDTLRNTFGT